MWQPLVPESAGLRAVLLLLPVAGWIGLFLKGGFTARQNAGALLGFVWQFQALLAMAAMFDSGRNGTSTLELALGFAVLSGANFSLVFMQREAWRSALASAIMLCLFLGSPLRQPGPFALVLAFAVVPGLALARCTGAGRRIYLRSTLQALCWACLLLWLFPTLVFAKTGMTWQLLLSRPLWQNAMLGVPLVFPGYVLLSALYQFAAEGNGTGFPYDPPQCLVTNGIYAYLSNPMQLGICLLMLWWGVMLGSVWVALSAVVALFLFVVFKDVCNGSCAIGMTDENWAIYQREVPRWIPRMRPWVMPNQGGQTAR
jgi:protein-S-isoprenylcysteine O-methyltransferase Ste14